MKREFLKSIKEDITNLIEWVPVINEKRKELQAEMDERLAGEPCTIFHQYIKNDYARQFDSLLSYYHNDQSYYLIYSDGSTICTSAEDLLRGEKKPPFKRIVYASLLSADDWYDTETGHLDFGDEIDDEFIEKRDAYEMEIEIKYGTEFGKCQMAKKEEAK